MLKQKFYRSKGFSKEYFLNQPVITRDTYLKVKNESETSFIKTSERIAVLDWFAKFCSQYSLSRSTYAHAVAFLDKAIELHWNNTPSKLFNESRTARLEATAVISLYLAAKSEETRPPRIMELMRCLNTPYDKSLMLRLESEFLRDVLHWRVHFVLHHSWLEILLDSQLDTAPLEEANDGGGGLLCSETVNLSSLLDFKDQQALTLLLDLIVLDLEASTFDPLIMTASIIEMFVECRNGQIV